MNAIVLAAGFGTRLKPWTERHPKALVPVGGKPMLQRILKRLESNGFDEIVVNAHHFAEQIIEFIDNYESDSSVSISLEKDRILNTGGGVLAALDKFKCPIEPILVHNVDILSNAPLSELYDSFIKDQSDILLLTSGRNSSRKLIFDEAGRLKGWHDLKTDVYRPEEFLPSETEHDSAFSGIYIIGERGLDYLKKYSREIGNDAFPIIDFFLWAKDKIKIDEIRYDNLKLIDIGKPNTLAEADAFLKQL